MASIRSLIATSDVEGLRDALSANPALANEGVPLAENDDRKEHPLHRICDGVMDGAYTDDAAVDMAKIFLEHGANVNGYALREKKDTPLIAATSLHADKVALLYIEKGANIHHAGTHGGTALHWASWTGRDIVVARLLLEKADVHKRCVDFRATPLFWAAHGFKFGGAENRHHQIECARLLLEAGAEKKTENIEGVTLLEMLGRENEELFKLLNH